MTTQDKLQVVCGHCGATNRLPGARWHGGREVARQSGALDLGTLERWVEAQLAACA